MSIFNKVFEAHTREKLQMIAERKVELTVHFDKRPGRRVGSKSEIFALPVVTALLLERALGELLSSALEASVS